MRKSVQWLVGIAISLVALGLAFRSVNLAHMAEVLRTANYFYVLPALGLIYLGLHARALSWYTILGRAVPYPRVFAALNEGYLLNNVLPFRLGELGRAYLVSRGQGLSTAQALSSVLIERVIDLCIIVGLIVAFLPIVAGLAWARQAAVVSAVITVVALIGLFVVANNRAGILRLMRWGLKYLAWLNGARLEGFVQAFIDGMAALQSRGRFFLAALCSAGAWVAAGIGTWFLLLGFLPSASLAMGFFVLVVTGLGIAVPSAPGNMGVWEAAVVLALTVFKVETSVAFSYAVLFHILNFGLTSALGAVALAREGETLTHLAQAAQSVVRTERTQTSAVTAQSLINDRPSVPPPDPGTRGNAGVDASEAGEQLPSAQ